MKLNGLLKSSISSSNGYWRMKNSLSFHLQRSNSSSQALDVKCEQNFQPVRDAIGLHNGLLISLEVHLDSPGTSPRIIKR